MTLVKLVVLVGLAAWFLVCVQVYKASRAAAWLAAPTVASCLFLSGTTLAVSAFVKGAFWMAPLWIGVLILALLHLAAARRRAVSKPQRRSRQQQPARGSSSAGGQGTDTLI